MKRIGVVFGGTSSEYEVSLKSTVAVLKALESLPYEVMMIGITKEGDWLWYQESVNLIENDTWFLEASCVPLSFDFTGQGFVNKATNQGVLVDIVFPVLHGGDGENGAIQGLFEMMKLAYVGCGVGASSISMNKMLLHEFAKAVGVKSTPSLLINTKKITKEVETFINEAGFPLFVKPNEAGSSKGISKVESEAELVKALEEAFKFDSKVILQKEVVGIEIGCSVLGNEDLTVGACDQVNLAQGFFDYEEKYNLITAGIQVPSIIDITLQQEIKEQAQRLYKALGCSGLARIDFFLTTDNQILLNEINTMPGFTDHSRYPMMMKEIGLSFEQIIEELIKLGVERHGAKLSKASESN